VTSEEASPVPFSAMVLGLRLSVERFEDAAAATDPIAAALPLFESLNWTVALERIRKDWVPDGPPPIGWNWPTESATRRTPKPCAEFVSFAIAPTISGLTR
jgi:hypothetical protein